LPISNVFQYLLSWVGDNLARVNLLQVPPADMIFYPVSSDFFPVVITFLRQLPFIGTVLSMPYIAGVSILPFILLAAVINRADIFSLSLPLSLSLSLTFLPVSLSALLFALRLSTESLARGHRRYKISSTRSLYPRNRLYSLNMRRL
jgi:hypothetical protein